MYVYIISYYEEELWELSWFSSPKQLPNGNNGKRWRKNISEIYDFHVKFRLRNYSERNYVIENFSEGAIIVCLPFLFESGGDSVSRSSVAFRENAWIA